VKSHHFLQLIALSALWGASFLFLRIASPVLGPQVLATGRVLLACLVLLLLMRQLKQVWPGREHAWPLLWLGVSTVALPFWLFSWAALRLPAGYSALLNATAVLFGTLAAAAVGEQHLSVGKVLGCLLGFVGVGLIVRLGPVEPTASTIAAALACVAAAACYGVSGPFLKRHTARMEPLALATALHLAALLVMLPGGLWTLPEARWTPGALACMAVLGVVTSGLGYWMHLRMMRHVSSVAALSSAFLIPVFGVTWGHVFLAEPLSGGIFVGGLLVLLAMALVTGFNPLRKPTPLEPLP
jgi:drug/metabolite transporter (DMT)-like permease